jgi:hypothetical protein
LVWNKIPRFSHPKMVWNGILRVFFFREMVQKRFPRVFLFQEMVLNGIPRFFSSEKWFGTEFRGVSLPPSVPSCSVFRGIIFLSENGNPRVVTVNPPHEETCSSVLLKRPPQQTSFSQKLYGGISLGGDIQESKQKFLTLAEKKTFL